MAEFIYKRLVDVHILHEYYLMNSDESSIFDIADEEGRKQFLETRILNGQYDLRKDFVIEASKETEDLLRAYKIRKVPMNTGFMLGMEVEKSPQLDGSLEYIPKIPFDEPVRLRFGIKMKNNLLKNFSNLPYNNPEIPAIYFFSNNEDGQRTFPFLSLPISNFQLGRSYEMGELAIVNGTLQEAIVTNSDSGAGNWRAVSSDGYLNENDRQVLPNFFAYTFPSGSGVTSANFTLRKTDGTTVKTIAKASSGPLSRVSLNYRFADPSVPGDPPPEIPPDTYDFEVTGNNGYSDSYRVIMDNKIYRSDYLGVVEIKIDHNASDYSLLRNNGSLITRKLSDGSTDPHPTYEIRIKSRITYWRYISNKNKELFVGANATSHLNKEGRVLVSIQPRSLSFTPTIFGSGMDTLFLPNPVPTPLQGQGNRVLSDIYVQQVSGSIEE